VAVPIQFGDPPLLICNMPSTIGYNLLCTREVCKLPLSVHFDCLPASKPPHIVLFFRLKFLQCLISAFRPDPPPSLKGRTGSTKGSMTATMRWMPPFVAQWPGGPFDGPQPQARAAFDQAARPFIALSICDSLAGTWQFERITS